LSSIEQLAEATVLERKPALNYDSAEQL